MRSSSLPSITSSSILTSALGIVCAAGLLSVNLPSRAIAAEPEPPAAKEPAPAAATTKPGAAVSAEEKAKREAWRLQMAHAPRNKGSCYTATYPDTTWKEVPCKAAPKHVFPPRPGAHSDTVGDGTTDYVANPPNPITLAEGSFDTVAASSVQTEMAGSGGVDGPNMFSLQLNSEYFPTSVCTAALGPKCRGWVQFVYDNSEQDAYVQYWLLNYDFTPFTASCPGTWIPYDGYCYQSAATSATSFSAPATAADLADMSDTGSGAGVTVTWFGATPTAISAPDTGIIPDLASNWSDAEFNVFGDGGGSQAVFTGTTNITVRTQVDTGVNVLPSCVLASYTGETNNLNLIATPTTEPKKQYPSIIFNEGSATTPASCATSFGDPHVTTFEGLYYNFYVTGDYVLADAGSDFMVQARQESGAKVFNNPNVSMNTAVAVKMGANSVLIYDSPEQVVVNGKATNVTNNQILNLSGGVSLMREGEAYAVTDESGDLVGAQLYNGWMNIEVGLGKRARSSAHGIMASPSGNALALRDGTVLKEPVSLSDLNVRFAQSWLVQANESLFPNHPIAYSAPGKEITAADLEPQAAAQARAACVAAGVTGAAHLDSCTLDTAVFKTNVAIKAFTRAITPRITLKLAEHP
jgi:hypothetical protein